MIEIPAKYSLIAHHIIGLKESLNCEWNDLMSAIHEAFVYCAVASHHESEVPLQDEFVGSTANLMGIIEKESDKYGLFKSEASFREQVIQTLESCDCY